MRKKIYFLAGVLLVTAGAARAEVQISASLNRPQIAMNEQAVLTVVISGSGGTMPEPQLPGLADFQVSNAGSSQSFSWINGQTSASVKHTFVLTPKEVGRYTIPPIRVQSGSQTVETSPLPLEVIQGNVAAVAPPAAGAPQGGAQAGVQAPLAFVASNVDKRTVFVGEPVTFSFRLYNRAQFTRQPQYQPPDTARFWAEDLPPQRNFNESAKGANYQVIEIKTALFPTSPGKLTIGRAALNVAVANMSNPFGNDMFGGFFSGSETRTLQSDPIAVTVNPLPTPAPAGFKGAVGRYSLKAELDKPAGAVGQPLTLSVTVAGEGNIKSLPDLTLPPLTNFRTFDANAATNVEKKDYRVQGSKVFKTVLIPTTSGTLSIPPIFFVYFDPAARAYKTLTTKTLDVPVKAGAGGSSATTLGGPGTAAAPGIKLLNQDIHYIKTPAAITSQARPLYRSKLFWAVNVLAFTGLLLCGILPLYRRLFLSDADRVRFRGARGAAMELIKEAEAAGKAQATRLLSRAMQIYLSDKLGLAEGEISIRTATEALRQRGVPAATVLSVRDLWERLDLLQFAPAQAQAEDLQHMNRQLRELVGGLEKDIRWAD